MKLGFRLIVLVALVGGSLSFINHNSIITGLESEIFINQDSTKKDSADCPCKTKIELTQRDLLCMNSCAEIYSCLSDRDIKAEDVFSYGFMIYTGEETIINRYQKDELPLIVRHNLTKAKKFVLRGVRLRDENGDPTIYIRKAVKIKFTKYETEEL